MNRDDRIKAIEFDHPQFIPVTMYFLPGTWKKYRERLTEVVQRYPGIFGEDFAEGRNYDTIEDLYAEGEHTDEWGCVWSNIAEGCSSYVTHHPVPTREAVHSLELPAENNGFPHGFMFLRLTYLRGYEELMIDFAEEPPELQMLIDVVLQYNLRQVAEKMKQPLPPIVHFGDDLGIQKGLPISPAKWRKYLKPCFDALYKPIREAGSYVYMHTDGCIIDIIPDLIDCGVNVVNPQVRANGLENLARTCKGKVCIDLDLDRQMFPFCTPAEIDAHVREAVETLGSPEGGLWLLAECAADVPLENIEAICKALEKYRAWFS